MSNYAELVRQSQEEKEELSYTFVTRKAIVFYISSVVTVVSMFFNWLPVDLDFEYFQINEVLGKVNVFTLPGALKELKETLGIMWSFLPNDVQSGYSVIQFCSYILLTMAAASIALYVLAVYLRLKIKDRTVLAGRLAAALAILSAVGFAAMVAYVISAVGDSDGISAIIGVVVKTPWITVVLGGIVCWFCAIMNMEPKENVVFYHDGSWKIDRGEKWRCNLCHRRNLSLLDRCYYCGTQKKPNPFFFLRKAACRIVCRPLSVILVKSCNSLNYRKPVIPSERSESRDLRISSGTVRNITAKIPRLRSG